MIVLKCQICKKHHDGSYGSGRFCSKQCANQSRKRNRRKTIARKKSEGTYMRGRKGRRFNPKTSKLQRNTMNLLHKHGLLHEVQFQVGKYYFDGRFNNILYEINGTYWHLDPRKYKINQRVTRPGGKKVLVADVWKRDNRKKLEAYKQGYHVIYIWQDDINKTTQIQLINYVRKEIQKINETKKKKITI